MANRSLPEKLIDSPTVAALPLEAALAWPWLALAADPLGRLIDSPLKIAARLFGERADIMEITRKIDTWLASWDEAGLIVRYSHEDRKLIQIVNWAKYQRVYEDSKSIFPAPPQTPAVPPRGHRATAANPGGSAAPTPTPTPTPTPSSTSTSSTASTPQTAPANAVAETKLAPLAVVPDWINAESWTDFVAFRKKIKKPFTPRAAANALKKLGEWRDDGYDPNEIIDQCVLNGWQGLYLPRDMQRSGKSQDKLPDGWIHADEPAPKKWSRAQ